MKITFIGSGNVATHLARALHGAGHQVVQVWSRDFDHADALACQVMAEPVDRLSLLYPDADLYLLAVNDDALFDLALDLQLRDGVVVHTSGSVAMSVLRPVSRRHGVLYAPQSFVRTATMDYGSLPFCVEGSSEAVTRTLEQLAATVSPHCYRIDSDQRRWLHLASVVANNFGNALNAIAADLLERQGIPFGILQPLMELTTAKALSVQGAHPVADLWRQQTGPAVRHDHKTLDRHRAMLKEEPALLALYDLMSAIIDQNTHRQ